MLPAIDFDDEAPLKAYEIQNVWPERNLSAEFGAVEATIS